MRQHWKTMMTGSRWAIFPGASNWVCQTNHLYIIFTCIHRNIKYLYECMCISVLAECLTFSSLHISFGSQSPQVMIKQNGLKAVYLVWTCFGSVWPLAHLKDCDFYVYLSGVLFIAKVNGINGRNSLPSSKPCLILRHVPRWYISHQLDSIIFCKWQLLQFTSAYIYSQGAEEEEWLNEFDPAILQQFLDGTCLRLAILIESILDECFPQL